MNITVLERNSKQQFGGVAYGKSAGYDEFRLNLSAKRATPFALDNVPAGFPTFPDYIVGLANEAGVDAQQKEKILGCLQNPPRELFGQYLSHLVDLALDKAGDKAKVTMRAAEALDLDVSGPHPKLSVREDGEMRTIEAAQVVLATGQREPLRPPFFDKIVDSKLFLGDIYSGSSKGFYDGIIAEQARKESTGEDPGNILVTGTGLSADDAVIRLIKSGYKGKITMISRNGLEHAGYGATSTEEYLKKSLVGEPRPEKVAELESKPPRFMRVVRAAAAAKEAGEEYPGSVEADVVQSLQREFAVQMKRGYTPEEVLGYWERFVSDIGDVLPDSACARIYNQYATWMAVHRVGTTPENARIIREAQASGQLEILAGFLSTRDDEKMREVDGKIVATISPSRRAVRAGEEGATVVPHAWSSVTPDGDRQEARTFDRVISGLGYVVTFDKSRDPFWANMIDKGLAIPNKKAEDGVELDPHDLTLIDKSGRRVEGVTAIGVPALGATMFGRFPHPEKPGVTGGRLPPFYANIVGITGGTIAMVGGLHERLMQDRGAAPDNTRDVAATYDSAAQIGRGALGSGFGLAAQAGFGTALSADDATKFLKPPAGPRR